MDNRLRERAARSGSRMMHGGFVAVAPFDDAERTAVDALIDTLIPPEEGWPSAAELGIAELVAAYLDPPGSPVSLYPHFRREEFPSLVGGLLRGTAHAGIDARVAALHEAEVRDPATFARVRDFIYYVYYGHPAVVGLIRTTTRYGADYHGGPQPEGYESSMEGWGERPPPRRGVFIPTDRVIRTSANRRSA
ncbi:hypothetical protein F6B41_06835 [Microbacterium lushaniae]|nr:hypothetical protein F6B41_10990 [Microbacterium lushaniae]KAA9156907.1 hypothetical protein F6B41_06835 [Microbacterium lushaniae]